MRPLHRSLSISPRAGRPRRSPRHRRAPSRPSCQKRTPAAVGRLDAGRQAARRGAAPRPRQNPSTAIAGSAAVHASRTEWNAGCERGWVSSRREQGSALRAGSGPVRHALQRIPSDLAQTKRRTGRGVGDRRALALASRARPDARRRSVRSRQRPRRVARCPDRRAGARGRRRPTRGSSPCLLRELHRDARHQPGTNRRRLRRRHLDDARRRERAPREGPRRRASPRSYAACARSSTASP